MTNAIYSATFNLEGFKCPFCYLIVSNCELDDFVEMWRGHTSRSFKHDSVPNLSVTPFHFQRLETLFSLFHAGMERDPTIKGSSGFSCKKD